jgi:hypothetical protein
MTEPDERTSINPPGVRGLASELKLPEEEVAQIYRDELQSLSERARIRAFLEVLAVHRVRLRLREHAAHVR